LIAGGFVAGRIRVATHADHSGSATAEAFPTLDEIGRERDEFLPVRSLMVLLLGPPRQVLQWRRLAGVPCDE
jgi:hypothetical protein